MKSRIEDKGKIGIYCIYNKINNKVYIGKSINIYKRSNINSVLQNNKPSIYGFIWQYNK